MHGSLLPQQVGDGPLEGEVRPERWMGGKNRKSLALRISLSNWRVQFEMPLNLISVSHECHLDLASPAVPAALLSSVEHNKYFDITSIYS
jgi:hypothetical protein